MTLARRLLRFSAGFALVSLLSLLSLSSGADWTGDSWDDSIVVVLGTVGGTATGLIGSEFLGMFVSAWS